MESWIINVGACDCCAPTEWYCCYTNWTQTAIACSNDPYGCYYGQYSGGPYSGPYASEQLCSAECTQITYWCCLYFGAWGSRNCSAGPTSQTACSGADETYGPFLTPAACNTGCPKIGACCSDSALCSRTTQTNCAELGGTWYEDLWCHQVPCPNDCYASGNPSTCGSSPPPASSCSIISSFGGCSPAPTLSVTIAGVMPTDANGSAGWASLLNNTFIFPTCGPLSITIPAGGGYYINVSVSINFNSNTGQHCVSVFAWVSSPDCCIFGMNGCNGYYITTSETTSQSCYTRSISHITACSCETFYDCSGSGIHSMRTATLSNTICEGNFVNFNGATATWSIT